MVVEAKPGKALMFPAFAKETINKSWEMKVRDWDLFGAKTAFSYELAFTVKRPFAAVESIVHFD